MAALEEYKDIIEELVARGKSHREISQFLQQNCNVERGASLRSVKSLCAKYSIYKPRLNDRELQEEVEIAIGEVGPTYGRKMMKGYLKSKGMDASERRVGESLKRLNPTQNEERMMVAKNLNPMPYVAEYFRHKLHMDQNEKLVMFGVTHVIARDGYSGKIVSHASMATKNNLLIYDQVFK
ncbi:uncharacterized protein LOC110242124 [Exaiptasia diaphana]|uniref:Uncharacterized protein n=1 Tax=Exaiptasia diaphana TaxID=2652724 RepID=A0A913XG85_EXADI|nr:uncharacterized protein LOC110242124 [Exaiptasia diaphana]